LQGICLVDRFSAILRLSAYIEVGFTFERLHTWLAETSGLSSTQGLLLIRAYPRLREQSEVG
jgi:hypothetical protein